jgi:L-fucose mutarotase/ribose pyranase (RbsD/FucU family)
MLKRTDRLLSPDACYALCAMGNGEEVAIRHFSRSEPAGHERADLKHFPWAYEA